VCLCSTVPLWVVEDMLDRLKGRFQYLHFNLALQGASVCIYLID
jgi:hypothetical protein